jgi:hypothetical protein
MLKGGREGETVKFEMIQLCSLIKKIDIVVHVKRWKSEYNLR